MSNRETPKTETPKTESPKTETPKTETSTPFTNPFAGMFAANPFTQAFPSFPKLPLPFAPFEAWMKEAASIEENMLARARTMATQLAQLTQDSLDYVAQLSAEQRKLATEMARRVSDLTGPKA